MRFNKVPIDRKEIDQSLLDIDDRSRTSLFAWNGQFSPQFVETMLRAYGQSDWITYDPFAGSGTVASESIRIGMGSIASELNPAAYHMAKIQSLANLSISKRNDICNEIARLIDSINENCISDQLKNLYQQEDGVQKYILALIIVLCDLNKGEPSKCMVHEKWDNVSKVIRDLPETNAIVDIERSDARHVPFSDDEADLVLTSPPYINVMNYHQQYRRSVELLGYPVLKIARSEFGSNRLNRGNRFLTVIEYAIDMGLAIRETSRVAKPNSRLIFVVGKESRVLGCPFSNSEIVWRVANEVLGLHGELRQQRQFKNKYGKIITEDILHFRNAECQQINDYVITSACQLIARDELIEASKTKGLSDERRALLNSAIKCYENIGGC